MPKVPTKRVPLGKYLIEKPKESDLADGKNEELSVSETRKIIIFSVVSLGLLTLY